MNVYAGNILLYNCVYAIAALLITVMVIEAFYIEVPTIGIGLNQQTQYSVCYPKWRHQSRTEWSSENTL